MPNVVSGEMNYTARRVKTRFLPTLLPDIKEPALAPTPGRKGGGGGYSWSLVVRVHNKLPKTIERNSTQFHYLIPKSSKSHPFCIV